MSAFAMILAAGFSSRMAPAFKPLLELPFAQGRQTPLARLCALYQSEGIRPVVIGGHRHQEVQTAAQACGADFVRNPHPEQGMLSSIKAGLAVLPENCRLFFIHPVDVPLVRRMTVSLLLEAAAQQTDDIYIPVYREQKGHPPLICGSLHSLLLAGDHPEGLRGLLLTSGRRIRSVPVADAFILHDMDDTKSYDTLCNLAPLADILSPEEAETLLLLRAVPHRGLGHARAVAALAEAFTDALMQARTGALPDQRLDSRLAMAGGLLHDICKGQAEHEKAAGHLFRSWGMERMARLVEDHRDMALPHDAPLSERELVFLADKYVHGSRPVSLEERFAQKLHIYAQDAAACVAIRGRRERAAAMARRFAMESGRDPAEMAFELLASFPGTGLTKFVKTP